MPKFPFTNYHELNLDWILKKVNALFDASEENARTISTYNSRLTSAEHTATSAETAASSAQQLADAAAANADNALSVAGTANTKADSALTAATDASSAVSSALTIAQEAQQTAGAAAATANDAAATAAGLESLANTANQNATAAVETAGTAVTTANNAAAAAQTADQKAVAAQQTANSAQTAANTNAGNISTLQSDVSELNRQISEKADVIISSASGSIASFADGADDMPIKSLIVNIEPVQTGSGEPSPTNIRPISGHTGASVTRTGKNLLLNVYSAGSSITVNGITYTNDNGVIKVTGTPTGNAYYEMFRNADGQRLPLKAGTYTISCAETTSNCKVNFTVVGRVSSVLNENQHSYTFTLSSDAEMYINVLTTGSSAVNLSLHVQLESGSSATAYEPYTGNQISITFPSSAGTVYGGTLDVTNGVLTVDRAMVDLGTLNWSYADNYKSFITTLAGVKAVTDSAVPNMISSMYVADSWVHAATNPTIDGTIIILTQYNQLRVRNLAYSDAVSFKTAMSGVPLVYELANSITYQLTPQELDTLLGTNNIWTDVGTVDVEYPADTKLYIDGKIAELQALVLEN